jgi:hypothetical protein
MHRATIDVRPLGERDHDVWLQLYRDYAPFHGHDRQAARAEVVWGWLMDPRHELEGVVAEWAGTRVGLAHLRVFGRPLTAPAGGFLDDLYVVSWARSGGVADVMLDALRAERRDRGWTIVHLVANGADRHGGSAFERVATRTTWVAA